jgi:hypothetical protein
VQNTGSAPATIGNIVVNLQRKVGGGQSTNYQSAAADVANATLGDGATTAKILAAASTENKGTFTESAASGKLNFTDADGNTAWSLVPAKTLAVGEVAALVFNAEFNNDLLNIPAGEQVRLEVIVTFGNAGARGGSGASGTNIDINGNGVIDGDEANVRSVPNRYLVTIPAVSAHNGTVAVSDEGIDVEGTAEVDFDTLTGFGTSTTSVSATYNPSVQVTAGGTDGGAVCNTATVNGADTTVSVQIGTSGTYLTFTYPGVSLTSPEVCVNVPADPQDEGGGGGGGGGGEDNPPPVTPTGFTTFSQGYYKNHTVTISGPFVIGVGPTITFQNGLVTLPPKGNKTPETIIGTTSQAINAYLSYGDGGTGYLTANLVNPTTSSAGNFGHQVLTMKLNVALSAAGVTPVGFGSLVYHQAGSPADGKTVAQIVALAEVALSTGNSSIGTPGDLIGLLNDLVRSFDNGGDAAWVAAHLSY